jgi:hypothetical protein
MEENDRVAAASVVPREDVNGGQDNGAAQPDLGLQ